MTKIYSLERYNKYDGFSSYKLFKDYNKLLEYKKTIRYNSDFYCKLKTIYIKN